MSDLEQSFIDESPPGMWPENQDSNFGVFRKALCDWLQDVSDQENLIFAERFVDSSEEFLDEWEKMLGIPSNMSGATVGTRRAAIKAKLAKGAFTRTLRRQIVETFVQATFGEAATIGPSGLSMSAGGVSLYSGVMSFDGAYSIEEFIEEFRYSVLINSLITVDKAGLLRALLSVTPAHINFGIFDSMASYPTAALTTSGGLITDANRATAGDNRPNRFPVMLADGETLGQTTLSGAMTNVQTTIPLTAIPANWPTKSAFRVMVDQETILIQPDGTLNPPCVRGVAQRWASAQAAAAHSSGAKVSNWFDGWMLGTASTKAYSLGGIPNDQIQVETTIKRSGTAGWKFIVRPGDANDSADLTRERAEIARLALGDPGETWFHSWSTFLPTGFHANNTTPGGTIFQLGPNHGVGSPSMVIRVNVDQAGGGPFTLGDDYFRIMFNSGVNPSAYVGTYTAQHDLVYATENVWHDFRLEVYWHISSGYVRIWHREGSGAWSKVFDLSGIPTLTDFNGEGSPPVQRRQGLYRSADAVKTNTIYHDEFRAARSIYNVDIDPLPPTESSVGIFPGATNLLPNDTFTVSGTAVITADPTRPLFGVDSKKIDCPATSDYVHRTFTGLTIGVSYVATLWVYREEVDARLLTFSVRNNANSADVANVSARSLKGWQRLVVPFVAAETAGRIRIILTDTVNKPVRFWIGASQLEAVTFPTPYTPVGTPRSSPRVQAPATNMDETQGWFIARVRPAWSYLDAPSTNPYIFRWRDDDNNEIYGRYLTATDEWEIRRIAGGTGATRTLGNHRFNDKQDFLVAFAWEAGKVKLSAGGSPFNETANTNIPVLAATLFDIGQSVGGSNWFYGDFLWAAWGRGTLTDADITRLDNIGITDPTPADVGVGLQHVLGVWTADDLNYRKV